ncbi:DUF6449 domain-containing protein [Oribacterium sp. HCP3S3_B9]|uniref:DUF6449 domain-containing protein n=1 Tax=Oribacterium sp. HCP3S3_B9 TaxID=3438946 RepID=UPI003F8CEC44
MTSRSLFFKYMKENTKQRIWSLALALLLCFFAFPVTTALGISIAFRPENLNSSLPADLARTQAQRDFTRDMLRMYSMKGGALAFMLTIAAVVLAASGFAYLHSKKKTDFYHSLPIRREMLYAVTCLNGFLYMAVAYLGFLTIAAVMIRVKGVPFDWGSLYLASVEHLCFFALVYMTAILSMLLTGNLVVGLLGTGVLFSWGPVICMTISAYFSEYFTTFSGDDSFLLALSERTSPVAWYVKACMSSQPGRMALWAMLAAAVLFLLGMLLYRRRPSEAAGHAMAFPITEPIIRFLIAVPSSLLLGAMFHSMMYEDGWTVFGLVCGLLLVSCIIEIIYHFDFKSLFAHKRQLLVSAVFVGVVFAIFRFDLFGYDRYLPATEKLASGGIYSDLLDPDATSQYHSTVEYSEGWYGVTFDAMPSSTLADEMQISDDQGLELLHTIAAQGVHDAAQARDRFLRGGGRSYDLEEGDEAFHNVTIAWHLRNGRTVYRSYRVNVSGVRAALEAVYNLDAYKTAMYPVLSLTADDVAGINYKEEDECSHVKLAGADVKAALLAAYQEELKALTSETRAHEMPIAEIQFKTNEQQALIQKLRDEGGNYTLFNHYYYYPIYPSFTKTIALLRACGVEVGGTVTPEKTASITLSYQGVAVSEEEMAPADTELGQRQRKYLSDDSRAMLTVTDPEQIREILAASASHSVVSQNPLMNTDDGMEICVDMKRSDTKFAVNVGQLKSSDVATDTDADQLKSDDAATGTDADAFETADDGDLDTFDDGAVPTFSEDADDDAYDDEDAYDLEEDGEVVADDRGSFVRNFYYGQIPQFVIDEFGLTPDIMEKNKV